MRTPYWTLQVGFLAPLPGLLLETSLMSSVLCCPLGRWLQTEGDCLGTPRHLDSVLSGGGKQGVDAFLEPQPALWNFLQCHGLMCECPWGALQLIWGSSCTGPRQGRNRGSWQAPQHPPPPHLPMSALASIAPYSSCASLPNVQSHLLCPISFS